MAATAVAAPLELAAPTERVAVSVDAVRRGPFVPRVRAPGTLVPEHAPRQRDHRWSLGAGVGAPRADLDG
jgi:hypothetical protein